MGHRLICCTTCGHVYSVNVTKQIYSGLDLGAKLKGIDCVSCTHSLTRNWMEYPENYVDKSGTIRQFARPPEIPDDKDSVIVEFPEIFE